MSKLQSRGSIARAAVVVALFSLRAADAQVVGSPSGPERPFEGIGTGVQYDIVNQAKAEARLQHFQAKLRRDTERGNRAAADYDARRIGNLRYRIAVDGWLIRKNRLLDPGYYPNLTDEISCAAIADATRLIPSPPATQLVPGQRP